MQNATASKPQESTTVTTTTAASVDPAAAKFQSLFADPDWQMLYNLAGIEDTPFENAATFVAYMMEAVGESDLSCQEVYTDLPNTHRYFVYCGDEKIAAYNLAESDWSLSDLELFYDRPVSITVQTSPDHTVYINAIALDESYTIRTVETKAENYLPDGIHGTRLRWQTVSDLLRMPQITVLDASGSPVDVTLNPDTGIYQTAEPESAVISQQQIDFLTAAATADARFALKEITKQELALYFDASTELYDMLVTNPRFVQDYTSSSVENMTIGEYVQYSETLFSANVKLIQKIIRSSGTMKSYAMDKTYFFTLTDGEYRVIAYTNEHMTDQVQTVRLIYNLPSGETVSYMADINTLTVSVPDMDTDLQGWATKTQLNENTVQFDVRVLPDGTVLGELQPLMLYPVM